MIIWITLTAYLLNFDLNVDLVSIVYVYVHKDWGYFEKKKKKKKNSRSTEKHFSNDFQICFKTTI